MGKQSARLWYRGKDHKDIVYQNNHHCAMYKGEELVWYRGLHEKFLHYFSIYNPTYGFRYLAITFNPKTKEFSSKGWQGGVLQSNNEKPFFYSFGAYAPYNFALVSKLGSCYEYYFPGFRYSDVGPVNNNRILFTTKNNSKTQCILATKNENGIYETQQIAEIENDKIYIANSSGKNGYGKYVPFGETSSNNIIILDCDSGNTYKVTLNNSSYKLFVEKDRIIFSYYTYNSLSQKYYIGFGIFQNGTFTPNVSSFTSGQNIAPQICKLNGKYIVYVYHEKQYCIAESTNLTSWDFTVLPNQLLIEIDTKYGSLKKYTGIQIKTGTANKIDGYYQVDYDSIFPGNSAPFFEDGEIIKGNNFFYNLYEGSAQYIGLYMDNYKMQESDNNYAFWTRTSYYD